MPRRCCQEDNGPFPFPYFDRLCVLTHHANGAILLHCQILLANASHEQHDAERRFPLTYYVSRICIFIWRRSIDPDKQEKDHVARSRSMLQANIKPTAMNCHNMTANNSANIQIFHEFPKQIKVDCHLVLEVVMCKNMTCQILIQRTKQLDYY